MSSQFVSNSQTLSRFDWRNVVKNISDDGAIAVPPPVTAGTLATLAELRDPVTPGPTIADDVYAGTGLTLNTMIADAEALLMGAACVAARYSVADLARYGGSLLQRIVSGLTIGLVLQRRGRPVSDEKALSQAYTEALNYLEQLRRGERIFFAVPDVPEAGLLTTAGLNPVCGVNPPLFVQLAARAFGELAPGIATRWPQR